MHGMVVDATWKAIHSGPHPENLFMILRAHRCTEVGRIEEEGERERKRVRERGEGAVGFCKRRRDCSERVRSC